MFGGTKVKVDICASCFLAFSLRVTILCCLPHLLIPIPHRLLRRRVSPHGHVQGLPRPTTPLATLMRPPTVVGRAAVLVEAEDAGQARHERTGTTVPEKGGQREGDLEMHVGDIFITATPRHCSHHSINTVIPLPPL